MPKLNSLLSSQNPRLNWAFMTVGEAHNRPAYSILPTACATSPQLVGPPKNPGQGWKKRARAFCQSFEKDAVLSSDQEHSEQQLRGRDSLVSKQKRKAEILFSRELRSDQHGTITEFSRH
ncbi:hypothetical protein SLA2020_272950 [Shorea laevis]